MTLVCHLLLVLCAAAVSFANASGSVRVESVSPGSGPAVTGEYTYDAMVTLYIATTDNGGKTPSGWSTRKEDGAAADKPFSFQPGVGLIEGWSEGVLQMKEGERALLHVPSEKGYGNQEVGSKGGAFYIPASSNLIFDIEILGKVGEHQEL